jgi:hypothetical protein
LTGGILSAIFSVGLTRIYGDALRRKAHWRKMFETAKQKWLTAIVAHALVAVIVLGALLVCMLLVGFALLPGMLMWKLHPLFIITTFLILVLLPVGLLALLFSLVNQSIALGNRGAIDAIKESVMIVKSNYLRFLLLAIVAVGIPLIPALAMYLLPIIGEHLVNIYIEFFVVPIIGLSFTSFYLKYSRKVKRRRKR